jgi:hemerythrin
MMTASRAGITPQGDDPWRQTGFVFSKSVTGTLQSALLLYATPSDKASPEKRSRQAERKLTTLFRSMCHHRHCKHEKNFYRCVNTDVQLGRVNCKALAKFYIAARRRYIAANNGTSPVRTQLTQTVDKWLQIHVRSADKKMEADIKDGAPNNMTPERTGGDIPLRLKEDVECRREKTTPHLIHGLSLRPKAAFEHDNAASIPYNHGGDGKEDHNMATDTSLSPELETRGVSI